MSVLAQFVFGSYARRDFNEKSDIDILCVTEEAWQNNSSVGKINVSFFPKHNFLLNASNGDLFILHIIREAKTIYDPTSLYHQADKAFEYKTSYNFEISQASDLGHFLIDTSLNNTFDRNASKIINKRLAWCARTILIARSVSKGSPVFDAHGLSKFAGSGAVKDFLGHKDNENILHEDLLILRGIILDFGISSRTLGQRKGLADKLRYFREKNNQVAVKTILQIYRDSDINSINISHYY